MNECHSAEVRFYDFLAEPFEKMSHTSTSGRLIPLTGVYQVKPEDERPKRCIDLSSSFAHLIPTSGENSFPGKFLGISLVGECCDVVIYSLGVQNKWGELSLPVLSSHSLSCIAFNFLDSCCLSTDEKIASILLKFPIASLDTIQSSDSPQLIIGRVLSTTNPLTSPVKEKPCLLHLYFRPL